MKKLHLRFQGHGKSVLNCWDARTLFTGALDGELTGGSAASTLKMSGNTRLAERSHIFNCGAKTRMMGGRGSWAGEKHVNTYGLIKWIKYDNYQKMGERKGGKESKTTPIVV